MNIHDEAYAAGRAAGIEECIKRLGVLRKSSERAMKDAPTADAKRGHEWMALAHLDAAADLRSELLQPLRSELLQPLRDVALDQLTGSKGRK